MYGNDAAFARPYSQMENGEQIWPEDGLTKREYFAARALQGLLSGPMMSEDGIVEVKPEAMSMMEFFANIAADAAEEIIKVLTERSQRNAAGSN